MQILTKLSLKLFVISPALILCIIYIQGQAVAQRPKRYEPTWDSLSQYQVPQWFKDGKFGIYTHWGVYSVPAVGPNGTWYSHHVYMNEDSAQRKYHEEHYGKLEEFGYKDFIPMFKAKKFDADEWAELFKMSGAKWAGPVAEHHDGFAMWNTKFNDWNSVKMGPKRDIVGELEKAIKKRGMRFVTTFHHETNWWFFPVWDKRYDCGNPKYSDLYGPIHQRGDQPTTECLDEWYGKLVEVIENYDPDLIWFDTGFGAIKEDYRKRFVAYYFNKALQRGKEVVITYKQNALPPGVGIEDLELAQMREMTMHEWMTDTTVDDGEGWSYIQNAEYKTVNRLVDNLVDRVSKNGHLLLNVGPKADGTIPEEAKELLLGIGEWLEVNGDAIYSTRCWTKAAEGPTQLDRDSDYGNETELDYTGRDVRFTVKGKNLYAICLAWPGQEATIKSVTAIEFPSEDYLGVYPNEIESITMLGDDKKLNWEVTKEGLKIKTPAQKPCKHAYAFKISLK